jgi:outer membrane protein OmpU
VTAGAEFNFDFTDGNLGQALEAGGYVLSLTTENAGLFFGDTSFAAETHWATAGSMVADNFSEADGETVLRGDVTFGGVDASISYVIADANGDLSGDAGDDLDQLSLGATADLGNFTLNLAYQDASVAAGSYDPAVENGDFNSDEVFGVSASTTFAGATVRVAYADNSVTNSTGVSLSYPVGPVNLSTYYVLEDAGDDSYGVRAVYADGPISLTANYEDRAGAPRYNLEGAYDLGNGLVARAGYLDRDAWTGAAYYVSGAYNLGGGASLLVSYAAADDAGFAADDEVGAPEYQIGTTVELTFTF